MGPSEPTIFGRSGPGRSLDGPVPDSPWKVRDHKTVQTAGPSGFWTVRTVRTVLDRGPKGLQTVRTAKKRRKLRYLALRMLFLVPMEHKM